MGYLCRLARNQRVYEDRITPTGKAGPCVISSLKMTDEESAYEAGVFTEFMDSAPGHAVADDKIYRGFDSSERRSQTSYKRSTI